MVSFFGLLFSLPLQDVLPGSFIPSGLISSSFQIQMKSKRSMKGLYLPSLLLDCQANITEQKDHELKGKQEE